MTGSTLRRCLALASLFAALALGPAAGTAGAAFTDGAEIVSASSERQEQGDDGTQFAAISQDGRYVAFQTRARNFFADDDPDPPGQARVGGIFRRDLTSGALQLVADGDLRDEAPDGTLGTLRVRGAQNPSISADGRFVAFSTAQRLVPQDTNDNIDVYVRDMTVGTRSTGAYDLVSARDGSDAGARYQPPPPRSSGDPPPPAAVTPGAEITRGAAISADGQRVVFRTEERPSDLPARVETDTPGFQVFLRDRAANATQLVTQTKETGEPAGGALSGAGISGDGSTVIWTGQRAPRQTRFLPGESENDSFFYYLWRRLPAGGRPEPARRITGPSDPDDPACGTGSVSPDPSAQGPCFGPLANPEGQADIFGLLPAMSADGRRLAFLTRSPPRPDPNTGAALDLFVTDMSDGVSRKDGTIELTREGLRTGPAGESPIEGVAMSADGRHLAMTTVRTNFVLPRLRLVGSVRPQPEARELYTVDLPAGRLPRDLTAPLERAARSFTGGDLDASIAPEVTLSVDAARIAFVSTAANHFFGDANDRPDAFTVSRAPDAQPTPPPPRPGPGGGGEPPPPDKPAPAAPAITVRARGTSDGRVVLTVRASDAGRIAVSARTTRKGRRVVGRASRKLGTAGSPRLTVRPSRRYRAAARTRRGLRAVATVTFTRTADAAKISRRVKVTFRLRKGRTRR